MKSIDCVLGRKIEGEDDAGNLTSEHFIQGVLSGTGNWLQARNESEDIIVGLRK